jgi:hypothetical protein
LSAFVENSNTPSMKDLDRRLALAGRGPMPPIKVAGIEVDPRVLHGDKPELEVVSEEVLDRFTEPPEEVIKYLTTDEEFEVDGELVKGRDFSADNLVRWEIGWHDAQQRISIPMRDCEGSLVGISGRAWPPSRKPKYLHPTGFRRDLYLFGEHRLVKGFPAILVEGQFDVMKLDSFGFVNVFGLMGSYIAELHVQKLVRWCSNVVIVPDGDKAGRSGAEVSRSLLAKRIPTTVVNIPDGLDPGGMTAEQADVVLGGLKFGGNSR